VQIGRFVGLAMVVLGVRFDLWLSLIGLFIFVVPARRNRPPPFAAQSEG